jgi:tRNA pseudouridine55 synthase
VKVFGIQMATSRNGILLVDKVEGETSFEVVRRVRKVLGEKKVGHSGTLDPFATGLLVVLLGQGTKLSPYLMSEEKRYLATLRLGVETDTQDPTGRVTGRAPVPDLDPGLIREKALLFVGEIEQIPPVYSAVHYGGRRSYDLARKGIETKPKKRRVTIHQLEITTVALPEITLEVRCSSGTYIRSLASDIGRELGTGAHLKTLRRMSSGPFDVKDALHSGHIKDRSSRPILQNRIIPPREALPDMTETRVDHRMARKIRNGFQPRWKDMVGGDDLFPPFKGPVKLVTGVELVAIMEADHHAVDRGGVLKTLRVFNEKTE